MFCLKYEIYFLHTKGTSLVIDSAKCHLTQKVNDKMLELGLKKIVVPPRMTNLLQPADVGWFANIKKELHHKWNEWYKIFTRLEDFKLS
jgi:hypothetical protein